MRQRNLIYNGLKFEMNFLKSTYNNKTVLITGHTGFKGSWLSSWLAHLGAEVIGISIDIPSSPSNFEASNLSTIIEDNRANICQIDEIKPLKGKLLLTKPRAAGIPIVQAKADAKAANVKLSVNDSQ